MKRLWSAFVMAAFAASPAFAQNSAPTPRPVASVSPYSSGTSGYVEPQTTVAMPITAETLNQGCTSGACGNMAQAWRPNSGSSCNTCDPCNVCGPKGRIWLEADYILWRVQGDLLPPLVTTGGTNGVLGTGATTIVGNSAFNNDWRSGARINLGAWLNQTQTLGVQIGGFFIEDASENYLNASGGNPVLARPFINANNGLARAQLVAAPGIVSGSVDVGERNTINAFDIALRGNACCGSCWRLDALFGYRYLRMADHLQITENLTAGPLAPGTLGVPVGTNLIVTDRFDTQNTFHGLQVGFTGETRFWNYFILSGTAKASFGAIDQTVRIDGSTLTTVPGTATVNNVGGLLALSSNIGRTSRSAYIVVPELNVNLGFQVTDNARIRIGYNLLYLASVVRPGEIIDLTVTPALIPPVAGVGTRPAYNRDAATDFLLDGINVGFEVRF